MKLGFMRGINKYDDQQLEQAILYYAKQYGLRLEFVYPDEELSRACIKAREEETDTIATLVLEFQVPQDRHGAGKGFIRKWLAELQLDRRPLLLGRKVPTKLFRGAY